MTVNDEAAFLKGCSIKKIVTQCFMLHLLLPLLNFIKEFKIWQMSVITFISCLLFKEKNGIYRNSHKDLYEMFHMKSFLNTFKIFFELWYGMQGNTLKHYSRSPLCSVCPSAEENTKKSHSFSYLNVSKQSYSDPTTWEAKREHRWKDEYPIYKKKKW